MGQDNDINKAQRRVKRYWYEDGLSEIATGCVLLLVGLLFFIEASVPHELLPAYFSAIGLIVIIVGGSFLARWILRALKERIIYPRTGKVAYRRPLGVHQIITGSIAAIMAGLMAAMLRAWIGYQTYLPMAEGLIIGAGLLYLAHRLGLNRFYFLAAFSALAGTTVSFSGMNETQGMAVYFMAVGIALIASGIVTLWMYLEHTRPLPGD